MSKEWLQTAKTEAIFFLQDLSDQLTGRGDRLIPPRRLMFDGPRDPLIFKQNGEQFLKYYQDLAGLQPHEAMLDIGSGIGRKTLPLTRYLTAAGRYAGFDINQQGVAWCQQKITAAFPNFSFQHVDVYNRRYHPGGRVPALEFRFPYADGTFDFVTAMSVFTHMFANEVQHYLAEAARVLKPGGRSLFSFFVLDEVTDPLRKKGTSAYSFAHRYEGSWVERLDRPEDVVAYESEWLQNAYQQAGFTIVRRASGKWSGRPDFLDFQDLILARRTNEPSPL